MAQAAGAHPDALTTLGTLALADDNTEAAMTLFEHAYDIDHNFAESIGALAVLDAVEGDTKQANRRAKTALKLDRECFSATLAKTLLLSGGGKDGAAKALFDQAITTPIGKQGRTIAQALVKGSFVG